MTHPFQDKCCTFIGRLLVDSRENANNRLLAAGGVPHPRVNWLTDYVVAGEGAENTKMYAAAQKLQGMGRLSILTEKQFWNTLLNDVEPPAPPRVETGAIFVPATKPLCDDHTQLLRHKRLMYLNSLSQATAKT